MRTFSARKPAFGELGRIQRARPPVEGQRQQGKDRHAGTQQPSTWSSTSPQACIAAYAVVGPTKAKPLAFSAFASPIDSRVVAGTAASGGSRSNRGGGANDQNSSSSPPCSGRASTARAFVMAARTLAWLRTIDGSAINC